jgi:hypothetical protein
MFNKGVENATALYINLLSCENGFVKAVRALGEKVVSIFPAGKHGLNMRKKFYVQKHKVGLFPGWIGLMRSNIYRR